MAANGTATSLQAGVQQRHSKGEDEFEAQIQAWNLILGFISTVAVKTVCTLRIPDLLAGGPLTLEEIASRLGSDAPNTNRLGRLLRLLCRKGMFSVEQGQKRAGLCPAGSRFCNNSVSELFVQDSQYSLVAMAFFMTSKEVQASFSHLPEYILRADGCAFDKVHGMEIWKFANSNGYFNGLINKAMATCSQSLTTSLLDHYHGFSDIDTLVDVGGGTGMTISLIKIQNPSMKAINFDLPHVLVTAPTFPDIEYMGGDMFESVPPANAIFLKGVLHNWDDEDCCKILKNCRKAIPETGKLIIVEMVVEEEATAEEQFKAMMDMIMMTLFNSKEREREQWKTLLVTAGFSRCSFIQIPGNECSVIEAFP